MIARVVMVAFCGLNVRSVEVECAVTAGLSGLTIIGLADKAVSGARERVRCALHGLSLVLRTKRIIISPTSANLPKEASFRSCTSAGYTQRDRGNSRGLHVRNFGNRRFVSGWQIERRDRRAARRAPRGRKWIITFMAASLRSGSGMGRNDACLISGYIGPFDTAFKRSSRLIPCGAWFGFSTKPQQGFCGYQRPRARQTSLGNRSSRASSHVSDWNARFGKINAGNPAECPFAKAKYERSAGNCDDTPGQRLVERKEVINALHRFTPP